MEENDRPVRIDINSALMGGVEECDSEAVRRLLDQKADPNWSRPGGDLEGYHQPTTPLRMLCFRVSDCCLNETHWKELELIARFLVDAGADLEAAMIISLWRYGVWRPPWDREEESPRFKPLDVIGLRYCFPHVFRESVKTVRLAGVRFGTPWPDIFETFVIPAMKRVQYGDSITRLEQRMEELDRQEGVLEEAIAVAEDDASDDDNDDQRQCSACGSTKGVSNTTPCVQHFGYHYLCRSCHGHRRQYEDCSGEHRQ